MFSDCLLKGTWLCQAWRDGRGKVIQRVDLRFSSNADLWDGDGRQVWGQEGAGRTEDRGEAPHEKPLDHCCNTSCRKRHSGGEVVELGKEDQYIFTKLSIKFSLGLLQEWQCTCMAVSREGHLSRG